MIAYIITKNRKTNPIDNKRRMKTLYLEALPYTDTIMNE